MRYTVSDTDSLRKVHLFVWAEPFDGASETRTDYFGPQDLAPADARARIASFLDAARTQASSTNPAVAAAASDAAARLQAFLDLAVSQPASNLSMENSR